jgi:hypothetical protein
MNGNDRRRSEEMIFEKGKSSCSTLDEVLE